MGKKKPKKKPGERLTAAAILARMHAAEAERPGDRREVSKKRRQQIKEKQRAAALRLWAPAGRLRKLQKERMKQVQQRRKSG